MDCSYPHVNWLEAHPLYTANNQDLCHSHGCLDTWKQIMVFVEKSLIYTPEN